MKEPVHDTSAEFGVRLSEAYKRFCRPDIRDEVLRAGAVADWTTRRTRSQVGGLTSAQRQRAVEVEEFKAAQSEAERDILVKLQDGRLVAIGFFVGPQGRDPDAPRRRIPEDVLRARNCRIRWREATISGNGLTFIDVRVGPTYEAPGAEAALIGCALSECFEKVVVEDWLYREMKKSVSQKHPGWRYGPKQYYFVALGRWPVRFEDWLDPADTLLQFKHPIAFAGEPRQAPPEEVIAVRKRIEDQVRLLITWFRDGSLVAEGTKEPPDHELTRERIVRNWWSRTDVGMDITDSTLWTGPPGGGPLMFSDIRIVGPESAAQRSIDDGSEQKSPRAKRKGGRAPDPDRDAAIREVQRYAEEIDGWNGRYSVLEKHLEDWFMEKRGNHPSDSTIRRYVRAAEPRD